MSLALGIGANTAIFSLFDQILLRSLPVQEPGQLVNLAAPGPKPGSQSCDQAGGCDEVFTYPMFRDLEKVQTVFTGIAAHRTFPANLASRGQTLNGNGMLVSGSYFRVLGVQPALGRLLGPGDDRTIGELYNPSRIEAQTRRRHIATLIGTRGRARAAGDGGRIRSLAADEAAYSDYPLPKRFRRLSRLSAIPQPPVVG